MGFELFEKRDQSERAPHIIINLYFISTRFILSSNWVLCKWRHHLGKRRRVRICMYSTSTWVVIHRAVSVYSWFSRVGRRRDPENAPCALPLRAAESSPVGDASGDSAEGSRAPEREQQRRVGEIPNGHREARHQQHRLQRRVHLRAVDIHQQRRVNA